MKFFCLSALIAGLLFACGTNSSASELRIALAPKVGFPKDSPVFTEDATNFYGTNIVLLTSKLLRGRAEAQLRRSIPASLRVEASRVANTSIISVVASGADDSVGAPFLSALFDQFIRFKREQKEKYYRDAIITVDAALSSVPSEYTPRLQIHREQLVIVSLLDVKPDFERIEY
ncbi:MAG: hypothetical protein JWO45_235 [Spartobacteria bacterium]|nr:hypothetical protein [Spartobacteria bacterium]